MKIYTAFSIMVLVFCGLVSCKTETSEWIDLIDQDLSQWDIFLGIPHKSSGIKGYEDVDDVRGGRPPLGLGNRNNIFSVSHEGEDDVLKITGEIFGALVSKEDFENYHLTLQIKWGEKKWEPRLEAVRNNGLLYHSRGEFGSGLWNTWMSSLEFEIEETNFGDFITINDKNVTAECPATKQPNGKYHFDPDAALKKFNWTSEESGRCFKNEDFEKPFGEWNTVELIAFGNTNIHIVNGHVVNAVYNPVFFDGTAWVPMTKGKLQLQSEAAETYFKNIKIKPIEEVPAEYKKYLK